MAKDIEKQIKKYTAAQQDRVLDFSRHSHARLGLGHTGGHLTYPAWLDLQTGFAQAKDAVFSQFDANQCTTLCQELNLPYLLAQSQASDAMQFLLRPDLGRLLEKESEDQIEQFVSQHPQYIHRDVLIVISGGLSPIAIHQQMNGFLPRLINTFSARQWSLAPIIINPKGRVALGDQINHYFAAKVTIMLIGERPGLSTPDSLGIYFTYNAKPGCTDEQRNCISNIHARGLSHEEAAEKLAYLVNKAITDGVSGIELKDDLLRVSL